MAESFRPAWWLPGPHSMTVWGRFTTRRFPAATRTETWATPDGDSVDVVRLDAAPAAPRLLLLHGLEGGVHSHYASGLFEQAARKGWGCDMLVFRGCNGRPNALPRSYHSGETGDAGFFVDRVIQEWPSVALGIVGVSLGGNVLLKWLGERGASVPSQLRAAAAVSVPFDLARSSRWIGTGTSRLYQRHFLGKLRRKALAKLDRFPAAASRQAVREADTLWEFDDAYTAVVHGFQDAADYYQQSSSIRFLAEIRVPTLLLSARDDPFHPPDVLDAVERIAQGNRCLRTEFHDRGGHVGFVAGSVPWRTQYYAEARVASFLEAHLRTQPG